MDVWTSTNKPRNQQGLAIAVLVVGAVFAYGFRHFPSLRSDQAAGFGVGILLLVIGIAALLTGGSQTIVVDPNRRRITVEDTNRFRTKTREILFADVMHVGVGYVGKATNLVNFYYLSLKLRDGKRYSLFAPGRFYVGATDRTVVAQWKERLEGYLGQSRPALAQM